MAKVRVNLNILKTDLQDAIQNQDFLRSGHFNKNVNQFFDFLWILGSIGLVYGFD